MFRFLKKIWSKEDENHPDNKKSLEQTQTNQSKENIEIPLSKTNTDITKDIENQVINVQTNQVQASWFTRLKNGLKKTQTQFLGLFGIHKFDEAALEQLEDALIMSDIGLKATQEIMENLRETLKKQNDLSGEAIRLLVIEQLTAILQPCEVTLNITHTPHVIMMIGVNGAGKTTTIGKLCQYFNQHQQKVLLAAADTFRAAAKEQLQTWGDRNGVHVISGGQDPASLSYDAVQSGIAKKYDIVLIDTAGRLPTQIPLLEEIKKVKRTIAKAANNEAFPQDILLVIDGTTGQNAIQQVAVFHQALNLTGLIVTKLDGTAKGGILVAIAKQYQLPIYFIGVGEALEDLQTFNASAFANALLSQD